MIELREWARSAPFGADAFPFVMIGKGPTFSRWEHVDSQGYLRMTLNHVVQVVDADIAHLVDLDVLADCSDRLLSSARYVVMPRYPHIEMAPQPRKLEELFDDYPVLAELDRQGRLVWYNLEYSAPVGDSPILTLRAFGSEPALQVLGELGVKKVRTIGIDGGVNYSNTFSATQATRLANGVPSFDEQFVHLRAIAGEFDIDLAPIIPPLHIFIGADETQVVAARVLEHSIRAHTSWPVEFTYLHELAPTLPVPKDPENHGGTGFSFTRFAIPKLCDYHGRAVYMDADMQVFGDVAELALAPFDGNAVLCTNQAVIPDFSYGFTPGRQLSVMVLDCARLPWDVDKIIAGLDNGDYTYQQLMTELCIVDPGVIGETLHEGWNHLERYVPGETRLVHYTNVPTQPWAKLGNPLTALWIAAYQDAVRAGAVPPEEVEAGVARGYLRYPLTRVLAEAPTRRASVSNALTDARSAHKSAQEAVRELEIVKAELDGIMASTSYKLARRSAAAMAKLKRIARGLRQQLPERSQ